MGEGETLPASFTIRAGWMNAWCGEGVFARGMPSGVFYMAAARKMLKTLTLALSHPMGEGRPAMLSLICMRIEPATGPPKNPYSRVVVVFFKNVPVTLDSLQKFTRSRSVRAKKY